MIAHFRFTWEKTWHYAPMAFWVHVPREDQPGAYEPPSPHPHPIYGYSHLRVEFGKHELVFSAPAQLDHFVEVLARKPLPSSRQLSAKRGTSVGPNGHWLSRLPAELKSPKLRPELVKHLMAIRKQLFGAVPKTSEPSPIDWPVWREGHRGPIG